MAVPIKLVRTTLKFQHVAYVDSLVKQLVFIPNQFYKYDDIVRSTEGQQNIDLLIRDGILEVLIKDPDTVTTSLVASFTPTGISTIFGIGDGTTTQFNMNYSNI